MIQYTKSEFHLGPKDGDRRVADRTKVLYFASADPEWVHAYAWLQDRQMFGYLGHLERAKASRVEPLSVGEK